jgi:hypothetical protein
MSPPRHRDVTLKEKARSQLRADSQPNQICRCLFERVQLGDSGARSTALLPVTISADSNVRPDTTGATTEVQTSSDGAIHIELPGRALISVESGANPALLR